MLVNKEAGRHTCWDARSMMSVIRRRRQNIQEPDWQAERKKSMFTLFWLKNKNVHGGLLFLQTEVAISNIKDMFVKYRSLQPIGHTSRHELISHDDFDLDVAQESHSDSSDTSLRSRLASSEFTFTLLWEFAMILKLKTNKQQHVLQANNLHHARPQASRLVNSELADTSRIRI